MTTSKHWMYVDDNNRVYAYTAVSKEVPDPDGGGIPYNFEVHNKDVSHALWDESSQSLTFDAEYDEFHNPPTEAV